MGPYRFSTVYIYFSLEIQYRPKVRLSISQAMTGSTATYQSMQMYVNLNSDATGKVDEIRRSMGGAVCESEDVDIFDYFPEPG